jgi:hypothetical protein
MSYSGAWLITRAIFIVAYAIVIAAGKDISGTAHLDRLISTWFPGES